MRTRQGKCQGDYWTPNRSPLEDRIYELHWTMYYFLNEIQRENIAGLIKFWFYRDIFQILYDTFPKYHHD